ncbi:MAG: RNA methyltransferase [Bacteroidetes bacterium]|nr:RNA methyltransferase [Bacteroidota bacterium]
MITKSQIKFVNSLHQKKARKEENLFIAEGEKVVADLLNSEWKVQGVFATIDYLNTHPNEVALMTGVELYDVTHDELGKISALTTSQSILAIAEIPHEDESINFSSGLKLVLDEIKDPGNMGALLRIADWFGIEEVICSNNSVDCFNPKVVQGSMGSLFRLKVIYSDLGPLFEENLKQSKLPVYGTLLEGDNIFETEPKQDGFIVMGNESNGISHEVSDYITQALLIPNFSVGTNGKPDSLNVAVAAGIVCAQFKRI